MNRNPFTINFGKTPIQYIDRELVREEIAAELTDEIIQNNCFMLTGVRGSGKTVTLTEIEKEFRNDENWIVVSMTPERDMLQTLVAKLYDSKDYLKNFLTGNVNLSKFGVGLNIETVPPTADLESALEIILSELKKKKKRLLVTVDEATNSQYMKEFVASFQLLIRQDMPIFLIMAGLYENILDLENEKTLTFLYRTPKYEMGPLNVTLIQEKYRQVFDIPREQAYDMAVLTKGYPFAYQVLGKYVFEEKNHLVTDEVIIKFDIAMATYIYDKIWSELSAVDKWYLKFIAQKDTIEVSELLKLTKKKKNEFSQYRARLRNKGIIDVSERGVIRLTLPRFSDYIKANE